MHSTRRLLSTAFLFFGGLVFSQDSPFRQCSVEINYPDEWENWSSQCTNAYIRETEEREKFNLIGVVGKLDNITEATLAALNCTYSHMHEWFKAEPSIGVTGSLFYDYPVPEKIDQVPNEKTAFTVYRFKTNIENPKTISPFNPEGGTITLEANMKWEVCAKQADNIFEVLYSNTATVNLQTSVAFQLYPFGQFALCIQNGTFAIMNKCLKT